MRDSPLSYQRGTCAGSRRNDGITASKRLVSWFSFDILVLFRNNRKGREEIKPFQLPLSSEGRRIVTDASDSDPAEVRGLFHVTGHGYKRFSFSVESNVPRFLVSY